MLAYYVHNIDPFFMKFGDWAAVEGVRWYGVCYAVSFLIALLMMNLYSCCGISSMTREQNVTFLSYEIIGVFVGGRLGYMLLYNFDGFVRDPLLTFAVWQGGMSSHGGFIGSIIAILLFCKRSKVSVLELGDICASIAPIGLFLGRIANFVNGELYGKISTVPWAVIFPSSAPHMANVTSIAPRHPSQLYEGFAEGFLLAIYVQFRLWCSKDLAEGQLAGEFLIGYSVARIVTEIYREVDAPEILELSRGQFYSVFLLLAGMALVFWTRRRDRRQNFY
jgi:phosphatidylglycerol:prolipoprotein diacylglycerol transferase